jgi:hypothetical protein
MNRPKGTWTLHLRAGAIGCSATGAPLRSPLSRVRSKLCTHCSDALTMIAPRPTSSESTSFRNVSFRRLVYGALGLDFKCFRDNSEIRISLAAKFVVIDKPTSPLAGRKIAQTRLHRCTCVNRFQLARGRHNHATRKPQNSARQ